MKTLKINFSLPLLVVALMAGLLLVGVNQAKAVVTFAQNTTLALGVGNITIEGGSSEVDEVTSTNTNITISMSADQTIVLLSSGQLLLSNSGGYGFSCEPTQSRLCITCAATQTVIVHTSPAASATPTPAPSTSSGQATPASRGFVNLESVSLNDGDVVSAAGSDDPDVYIVNPHGYKRLFLNPVIFGFYGLL